MTKEELIAKGKTKVRGNSDLMLIYINLFQEQFGYKPNCAGCTFENDWKKFIAGNSKRTAAVNVANTLKTFKLKKAGSDILHFKKDGKTHRRYANKITEDFAINFLTYGTETEISERKKLFDTLPEQFRDQPAVKKTRKKKE